MADVLKVKPFAKIELTRNGLTLYQQIYNPDSETYTEHSSDRLVLSSNMASFEEYDLTYIGTAQHLFVDATQTVQMCLDTTSVSWSIDYLGMVGSFTHLYFKNTSTTETTVTLMVTD
jgi:hypothetical protein